jgi:hypothetical protein
MGGVCSTSSTPQVVPESRENSIKRTSSFSSKSVSKASSVSHSAAPPISILKTDTSAKKNLLPAAVAIKQSLEKLKADELNRENRLAGDVPPATQDQLLSTNGKMKKNRRQSTTGSVIIPILVKSQALRTCVGKMQTVRVGVGIRE